MTLDFLDTAFYTDWIAGTKTTGLVLTMTGSTIPGTSNPFIVEFIAIPPPQSRQQFG